jgi:hypothetical protein
MVEKQTKTYPQLSAHKVLKQRDICIVAFSYRYLIDRVDEAIDYEAI